MRALAVLFFILAVVLATDAARDQTRGFAEALAPRMLIPASSLSVARLGNSPSAVQSDDPQGFRGLMAYQWIRVALCAGAGYAFLSLAAHLRRTDPFATKAP